MQNASLDTCLVPGFLLLFYFELAKFWEGMNGSLCNQRWIPLYSQVSNKRACLFIHFLSFCPPACTFSCNKQKKCPSTFFNVINRKNPPTLLVHLILESRYANAHRDFLPKFLSLHCYTTLEGVLGVQRSRQIQEIIIYLFGPLFFSQNGVTLKKATKIINIH